MVAGCPSRCRGRAGNSLEAILASPRRLLCHRLATAGTGTGTSRARGFDPDRHSPRPALRVAAVLRRAGDLCRQVRVRGGMLLTEVLINTEFGIERQRLCVPDLN